METDTHITGTGGRGVSPSLTDTDRCEWTTRKKAYEYVAPNDDSSVPDLLVVHPPLRRSPAQQVTRVGRSRERMTGPAKQVLARPRAPKAHLHVSGLSTPDTMYRFFPLPLLYTIFFPPLLWPEDATWRWMRISPSEQTRTGSILDSGGLPIQVCVIRRHLTQGGHKPRVRGV